jgi:hypothetical protein
LSYVALVQQGKVLLVWAGAKCCGGSRGGQGTEGRVGKLLGYTNGSARPATHGSLGGVRLGDMPRVQDWHEQKKIR